MNTSLRFLESALCCCYSECCCPFASNFNAFHFSFFWTRNSKEVLSSRHVISLRTPSSHGSTKRASVKRARIKARRMVRIVFCRRGGDGDPDWMGLTELGQTESNGHCLRYQQKYPKDSVFKGVTLLPSKYHFKPSFQLQAFVAGLVCCSWPRCVRQIKGTWHQMQQNWF